MAHELVNGTFHTDINLIFESFLKKEDEPKIVIYDIEQEKVLMKTNYDKIVFHSDLSFSKIKKDGTLEKVDNPNFKAVVVKRQL